MNYLRTYTGTEHFPPFHNQYPAPPGSRELSWRRVLKDAFYSIGAIIFMGAFNSTIMTQNISESIEDFSAARLAGTDISRDAPIQELVDDSASHEIPAASPSEAPEPLLPPVAEVRTLFSKFDHLSHPDKLTALYELAQAIEGQEVTLWSAVGIEQFASVSSVLLGLLDDADAGLRIASLHVISGLAHTCVQILKQSRRLKSRAETLLRKEERARLVLVQDSLQRFRESLVAKFGQEGETQVAIQLAHTFAVVADLPHLEVVLSYIGEETRAQDARLAAFDILCQQFSAIIATHPDLQNPILHAALSVLKKNKSGANSWERVTETLVALRETNDEVVATRARETLIDLAASCIDAGNELSPTSGRMLCEEAHELIGLALENPRSEEQSGLLYFRFGAEANTLLRPLTSGEVSTEYTNRLLHALDEAASAPVMKDPDYRAVALPLIEAARRLHAPVAQLRRPTTEERALLQRFDRIITRFRDADRGPRRK